MPTVLLFPVLILATFLSRSSFCPWTWHWSLSWMHPWFCNYLPLFTLASVWILTPLSASLLHNDPLSSLTWWRCTPEPDNKGSPSSMTLPVPKSSFNPVVSHSWAGPVSQPTEKNRIRHRVYTNSPFKYTLSQWHSQRHNHRRKCHYWRWKTLIGVDSE